MVHYIFDCLDMALHSERVILVATGGAPIIFVG